MNLGKHLGITVDEVFINYEIVDSKDREWVHGRERKSLDQEQYLKQITQLIKHKHAHYNLTDVKLIHTHVKVDEEAIRKVLQNQINVPIK